MTGKHIAGLLIAACLGAVIAAGPGDARQPASGGGAILAGGCSGVGGNGGSFVIPLGATNGTCTQSGSPHHGVPMPTRGQLGNLSVTGSYTANAETGTMVTVYVNGSPTALTCMVASGGKCQDVVDHVLVNAGDEVGAVLGAPDASAQMIMSFEMR